MFHLHKNVTQTDLWRAKFDRDFYLNHGWYFRREQYPSAIEGFFLPFQILDGLVVDVDEAFFHSFLILNLCLQGCQVTLRLSQKFIGLRRILLSYPLHRSEYHPIEAAFYVLDLDVEAFQYFDKQQPFFSLPYTLDSSSSI